MEVEMKKNKFSYMAFFPNFHNQDEFFERIANEENVLQRILGLCLLLTLFSFFYGVIMGSHHGFSQALSTSVKIPVLFTLTLLICFPAFLIMQFILGSKLRLSQMIAIILSGFVLSAAIMIAFAPIIVFFQLTGGNYHFLILLHISIWVLSGFFGMKIVVGALKFSCEKKNIYPQIGVVVFRFWIVILAFVGIQLAWNLRPFLGKRGEPFRFFRKYEGNFYTAVIYSVRQLASHDDKASAPQENSGKENVHHYKLPYMIDQSGEKNVDEQ